MLTKLTVLPLWFNACAIWWNSAFFYSSDSVCCDSLTFVTSVRSFSSTGPGPSMGHRVQAEIHVAATQGYPGDVQVPVKSRAQAEETPCKGTSSVSWSGHRPRHRTSDIIGHHRTFSPFQTFSNHFRPQTPKWLKPAETTESDRTLDQAGWKISRFSGKCTEDSSSAGILLYYCTDLRKLNLDQNVKTENAT